MGNRRFKLNRETLAAIAAREQETRDAQALRRLQAVRLYGSGESIGVVQRVSGASERTMRRWVDH